MVVPPEGGKPIPYTRASSLGSTLEDPYNLIRWQKRNVATGLSLRPDLLMLVSAYRNSKKQLDKVVEQAEEAGGATAAANVGTALHAICERIDRGEDPGPIPQQYQADIAAYQAAVTKNRLKVLAQEQFVACDELKTAGTFDKIYEVDGRRYIGDLKTGQGVDLGALKYAVQFATYSRGLLYDWQAVTRTRLDVDQSRAILIHLPAGTGKCHGKWVNLHDGWDLAALAAMVRDARTTYKAPKLYSSFF